MKRKVIIAAVVAIGCLALSTPRAHAGAGGTPTPLTSFFVCQGITGSDPGQVVNITVPLLNLNLGSIKIGGATLACTFAQLFNPTTGAEISPNPTGLAQDLKCYALSNTAQAPRRNAAPGLPPTFNVEDTFGGSEVQTTQSRYLCAPATFTIP